MHDLESMSHVRWECKYHVVFMPKYRHKVFYGKAWSANGVWHSDCQLNFQGKAKRAFTRYRD
jgi:REP element-mobilizing transposase RayT